MKTAFKFQLRPTKAQSVKMHFATAVRREVYNWASKEWRNQYLDREFLKEEGVPTDALPKSPNGRRIDVIFNDLKRAKGDPIGMFWTTEVSKCVAQQAINDLQTAYDNFFERPDHFGKPRINKTVKDSRSFKFAVDNGRIDKDGLYIPTIGSVKLSSGSKRKIPFQKLKNVIVTVKKDNLNCWYASYSADIMPEQTEGTKPISEIGIDVGIKIFACGSDGSTIANPEFLKKASKKLAKAQRCLSRKKKGSNNRKKAAKKVKRIHKKVANRRRDFHHKESLKLVKQHTVIVLEDLDLKNMTKLCVGLGRAAKAALNRALLDAGFAQFIRYLAYKGDRYNCKIIKVDPKYTSTTCSNCGDCRRSNRKSQSEFVCQNCGFTANADLNASRNIYLR